MPGLSNAVVCIQKATYESLVLERLIHPLGGLRSFVKPGDRVLLKVNLLRASTPEQVIVTDPRLVRAVAEAVLQMGGKPFIADSPAGPFSKHALTRVYEMTGLTEVAQDLGIELNMDTDSEKIAVPNGKRLSSMNRCSYVRKADVIISLPKIKTHSLMVMSVAVKNMFGTVAGLTKAKYHSLNMRRAAFADMLLDVLSVVPPHLSILDGVVGMEGEGPGTSGTPVSLGVVMASVDTVAMDVTVCRMLGLEPVSIPVLRAARLRGLWPAGISYPLSSPEEVAYRGFVLPKAAERQTSTRFPRVTESCNGCEECVRICPRCAIGMVDQRASIDYSRCIRCYCCSEVCPESAIALEDLKKD